MNLTCKMLMAACLCLPALGSGMPAAKAEISQTYFATAKPAPKPKPRTRPRSDWATVQGNLECPPPARPACGR